MIPDLMDQAAMPLGDLIAQARVAADAPVLLAQADVTAVTVTPTPSPATPKGVEVNELLSGEAVSFADLLAQAGPNGKKRRAPAKPAKTEALTVTVTIGADAASEPVAAIAAEPAPKATKTVVATTNAAPQVRAAPEAQELVAAAMAPQEAMTLEITEVGGVLKFKPQSLVFPKAETAARVVLNGRVADGLSIFVRDQNVAHFDQRQMLLSARKKGVTEVYAVLAGKMYIVPVTVEDAGGEWDLKVPDALVSLDGVFQSTIGSAIYPGLEQASQRPQGAGADDVSLTDSLADTARTSQEVAEETARYVAESADITYKPVTVQIIDDRSAPRAGKIYPVANAVVRVVGTEFAGRTDATGHLTIRDMPVNSRFLLTVDDQGGIIRSGAGELTVSSAQSGVARVRVTRNFSFDAYANIAGSSQHSAYASYCGTLADPQNEYQPIENAAVGIDAPAEGPFYFNRYGFLDRSLRTTGPDGRFCFYNVLPGPMALSVYEDGALVATYPVSTYAGRHVDDEIVVGSTRTVVARLAAMGTAHEQLGSDARAANSYKTIDMIDLIPLGTETPMMQLAPGRVQASEALPLFRGRARAFAQASEFEPAVYTFTPSQSARDAIVPLLPRGFVEDMSVYAQVSYNPELGVVLTEYGHPNGTDGVALRLVDQYGRDVGDGWYYSEQPVTKAIFFNVPAGTYALIAETSDGFWLGADTVIVYNETVSYMRMGTAVRYRP